MGQHREVAPLAATRNERARNGPSPAPLTLLVSQGQAEIFVFAQRYAGDYAGAGRTSNLTLDATKAYTPWEVPHWAYQGASRRYWDFDYNAKSNRWASERVLHHYGSGINSEVLLVAHKLFPNDTIALRAGYAAAVGQLSQINARTGAPSMGLHGDP